MSDELKDGLKKDPEQKPVEIEDRAGKRISQLSTDLEQAKKEKEEAAAKAEAAVKEAVEAKAELAFTKLVSKTPNAEKHKADILAKAQSTGLSIEEAATLILAAKGELDSAPAADTADLGGAATVPVKSAAPAKASKDMTQAEREAELRKIFNEQGTEPFRGIAFNA